MGPQEKTTPKNYQVRISVNALQNIEEITGYIAFVNQQPLNAIKLGDAFFATIDRISLNPLAFRECEELPTKAKIYRRATCFSWLLIYRIGGDQIVILGVIHSSRRPSRIKSLRKIK
jgi:plasmid stabilization system protein ParE